MTPRLARICRHLIKGHGREDLVSVALSASECLPWDRHWAVAHDAAKLHDGWNPCVNFARGAKAPALMAVTSQLDEATGTVALSHPELPAFSFRPDDPADLAGFLSWIAPLVPPGRAAPARIVTAGRGMTDSDFPSVSIVSLASLADLSAQMGHDLSPDRWRGNLWIEGTAPWAEWDWVGRTIRVGDAELEVRERITRCRATSADPLTGRIDADTLAGLRNAFGHEDFGLYSVVTRGGLIRAGDRVKIAA